MNRTAPQRARDLLLGCSRPLLVTHVAPDGDAIGSILGLTWALRRQHKSPTPACQDSLPRRFGYLPGFEEVTDHPQGDFDLLVALDCADRARMGKLEVHARRADVPLLNVDHHVTNTHFGTVNLVDPNAASTTHILWHLLDSLAVDLDVQVAICLLTGLVADTRGFRTANTTAEVLQAALTFVRAGASLPLVARNTLDRRPVAALRLWGAALQRLEVSDGLAWVTLPLSVQQACQGGDRGTGGLASMLLTAEGVEVAAVFTERPDGQVEVDLRAGQGFDVAYVASALGGGGHARAAGCLIPGPLDQAQERVLETVNHQLSRQRMRVSDDG
jgi:phosphoesterase RecJ-like protein